MHGNQRLLVSVRGPLEALEAARGGAQIVDVEYPASALGTPYPLNIHAVRLRLAQEGLVGVSVSTNIGEEQRTRSSACQAALGVAVAGADLVKFGLAGETLASAAYLARSVVRTVQALCNRSVLLIPAVFVDEDQRRFFDPMTDGPKLAAEAQAHGLLVDTYDKLVGRGLLDLCEIGEIARLATSMHSLDKQLWVAGSITVSEMPALWNAGVDVVCVRGAACERGDVPGRFGAVQSAIVSSLAATIPRGPVVGARE